MTSAERAKAFEISKREVYAAWLRVKANRGAGGVDDELADKLNPTLRGWFNYFGCFYRSELSLVVYCLEDRLIRWARSKYRWNYRRAAKWLARLKCEQPRLLAHWVVLSRPYG